MTPAPVGLRCPDHAGKAQGVQRVTRRVERAVTGVGSRRANSVTMALIAVNVFVYAAELAAGGSINGTANWLFNHGALFASGAYFQGQVVPIPSTFAGAAASAGVAHGEWWRMVTAAFLHYGPLHLALNMYSLFYAGTILEHVIDRWRFALLYVVTGICGSAGALLLSPDSLTVGASGAIFGILGALFILERRGQIASGGQIAGLIVINLIFTFALSNISVGGHIGGLVSGIVLMYAFLEFRRSMALSVASAAVLTAIAFVVAYAKVRGYA
jgi:membrane associated rhomboid family serine protease